MSVTHPCEDPRPMRAAARNMRALGAVVALGLSLASACERAAPIEPGERGARAEPERDQQSQRAEAPERLPAARLERARERVLHFECNRCHTIEGVEPAPVKKHCVRCHVQIEAGTYEDASAVQMAEWSGNIEHLTDVPSLESLEGRWRRDWLVRFLQRPHDLRPKLGAQMPRLAIGPEDAEAIADYFYPRGAPEPGQPPEGDAARGEALLAEKGCGSCHGLSSLGIEARPIPVEVDPEQLARAIKLAPDLIHVRLRHRPDTLARWIRDPSAIKPSSSMPTIPMSEQDARDIATYLLTVREPPRESPVIPERLPVLEREVAWPEVKAEVFRAVCWHCHSEAAYVDGDGGPGNTGGFGFEGRGLSVAEYASINSGMRDRDGERVSVFRRREDGTPWIVAAMHARHAEIAGQPVEGIRGMPLGLPPMTLEQIQLVESWIAQGRPRR